MLIIEYFPLFVINDYINFIDRMWPETELNCCCRRPLMLEILNISCLKFWDEAWWFLSLRVFGLLSSSLLLFPQRLRPICPTAFFRCFLHLYPVMANGIRTGDPCGFNKGRSWKFRVGSRVWQTPEEDRRTYRPKCYGNNNKNEDNSQKTLNDKNIS